MPAATSVPYGALTCPTCGAALSPQSLASDHEQPCPGCARPMRGQVFRLWSTAEPHAPTTSDRALEGEAACFFHPENRAALACDSCGRFVCSVCDLHVGSRHLCPLCLGSGLNKQKLPEIVSRRFLWSWAAFWLGLLPLIFIIADWWCLTVTGTSAIIIALVGWKRPGSVTRGPQHWIALTGILLGFAQLGITFAIISMIVASRSR
jgi:hypothetical protein